jgi:hypothetical protein
MGACSRLPTVDLSRCILYLYHNIMINIALIMAANSCSGMHFAAPIARRDILQEEAPFTETSMRGDLRSCLQYAHRSIHNEQHKRAD